MRSSLRLTMPEDEPVYLQVTLNVRINLPVIELGGGGGRLLCYKCQQSFDDLNVGHSLGPSVLMLLEEGMCEVEPVIRWKKWPCIGVQFIHLSNADREHIFKVLFRVERKKLKQMKTEPQEKPRGGQARLGLPHRVAR